MQNNPRNSTGFQEKVKCGPSGTKPDQEEEEYDKEPKLPDAAPEIEFDEDEPMIGYRIPDGHCSQSEEDFWRGL